MYLFLSTLIAFLSPNFTIISPYIYLSACFKIMSFWPCFFTFWPLFVREFQGDTPWTRVADLWLESWCNMWPVPAVVITLANTLCNLACRYMRLNVYLSPRDLYMPLTLLSYLLHSQNKHSPVVVLVPHVYDKLKHLTSHFTDSPTWKLPAWSHSPPSENITSNLSFQLLLAKTVF